MAELPPGLLELRKARAEAASKTAVKPEIKSEVKREKSASPPPASPVRDASPKRESKHKSASKKVIIDPAKWTPIEGRTNYALWSNRLKRYVSGPTVATKKSKKGKSLRFVKFQLAPFWPNLSGFSAAAEEVLEIRNIESGRCKAVVDMTGYDLRVDVKWNLPKAKDGELEEDDEELPNGAAQLRLSEFVPQLLSRTADMLDEERNWAATMQIQTHPNNDAVYAIAMTNLKVKLVKPSKKQTKKERKQEERMKKEEAELLADLENSSFKPQHGKRVRRSTMDSTTYRMILGRFDESSQEEE